MGLPRLPAVVAAVAVVATVVAVGSVPVAADHCTPEDEDCDHDDGDGGSSVVNVNIDIGSVVDAIRDLIDALSDFTGSFSAIMTKLLFQVFFQPFLDFLRAAAQAVFGLMVWLPDTTISEVRDIHRDVYMISLLLGSLGFSVIGVLYMGYEPFGIPFARVRPLIPKLVAALVVGGVAPWLLQYPVDLAELAARALAPDHLEFSALLMLSGELILVSVVEAFVVLALLAVLTVQKIYILFAASTASLIAVLAVLPFRYTRRIAEQLIGAFWGFVLVSPLEVIAFRLTLALLTVTNFDAATWIIGLGGLFLMGGIPFIVVSAGMAAAGPALAAAHGATRSMNPRYNSSRLSGRDTDLATGRRDRGNRLRYGEGNRGGRR